MCQRPEKRNSPFRHLAGPLAVLATVVEHLAQLAPVTSRNIAVDAHVEELAVVRVGVPWVRHRNRFVHLGARKGEHVLGGAARLAGLVRPCADAGLRIEHQPGGTGDHVELAVDAVVELVARARLAAVVAVQPGAVGRGLGSF